MESPNIILPVMLNQNRIQKKYLVDIMEYFDAICTIF